MEISKELEEALARIRKGLAETKTEVGEIVDLVKKGAIESSDKALDKTKKSVTRVKEAIAETETKAEKETEETKVFAKEYLDKAKKAVTSLEKELTMAASKIKAKSVEGLGGAQWVLFYGWCLFCLSLFLRLVSLHSGFLLESRKRS